MRSTAACYDTLRDYVETLPLADCHDHTQTCGPKYEDAIQVILSGYFPSDIHSASSDADMAVLMDTEKPMAERWPVLERAWKRTWFTGYGQVTRRMLDRFYGETELSLPALERIQERLVRLDDPEVFESILEEARIAIRIADVWPDVRNILDGTLELAPRARLAISLPAYHGVRCRQNVDDLTAPLERSVTSLDEYLESCWEIFKAHKKFGAVCFKDQSAYSRTLAYDNPPRADAERLFNRMMEDPRRTLGYPEDAKPLDDFLFHEFLRFARDLALPVQIHTGHMAGVRNDIVKTNAAGLTRLLELHRDVRFDLFHANWPYSGELIYLGKNYPNVTIDFCWANIIDPFYCQQMLKQALSAVPHGKIHGYGSDFGGCADRAWAHASIARDNVAIALADLVDQDWLDLDEAKEVARAWLFENANAFFALGL